MVPPSEPDRPAPERRVEERRATRAPLEVRLETLAIEGVCDNLSENGVFFTSQERLRVRVHLTDAEGVARELTGHLVRVQRMSAESTGYAIELDRA